MLIYFGSCVVSAVLLRLPHLACEAGENDIGSCLCQEEQNAEKVDAADTTWSGHVTVDLGVYGLTWQKSTESTSSLGGRWIRSNLRTRVRDR